MKIVLVDYDYSSDYETKVIPTGEPFEVTEEEYEVIRRAYTVRIVMDKEFLLESAKKIIKEQEERQAKYRAENEKRAAKAAATAEKRKLKQFEKLKKELGLEDSIS